MNNYLVMLKYGIKEYRYSSFYYDLGKGSLLIYRENIKFLLLESFPNPASGIERVPGGTASIIA